MTTEESTLVNSHVLCMKCRLACSLSLSGNRKPNQNFSATKSKSTDKIQFKKDQIKNLIDLTERMEWTLKKISIDSTFNYIHLLNCFGKLCNSESTYLQFERPTRINNNLIFSTNVWGKLKRPQSEKLMDMNNTSKRLRIEVYQTRNPHTYS